VPVAGFDVIDFHVHIQPWKQLKPGVLALWQRYHPDFEELLALADDPRRFIKLLDQQGIAKAVLINYVSPDVMGFTNQVNEFVSAYCKEFPNRLIPCGSLHPGFVHDASQQMKHLIEKLGIRMIKIHPPHQLFYPNDYLDDNKALRKIYEAAQEYGVPVMFHTGTSIFPGARVKYGNPLCLDDVALDFPQLKIMLAHGGRPLWMDEAFFLLRRHENIYLDISGIPPQSLLKYFPRLEQIVEKTIFGSDWPGPGVPGIRANVERFLELPLADQIKRKILYENAAKLLSKGSS
jgi:predicted TIM-barrel fold metal-dependent hydrolase